MKTYKIVSVLLMALLLNGHVFSQNIKIVTNQVGYDLDAVKHAVIVAGMQIPCKHFSYWTKKGNRYSAENAFMLDR